MNFQQNNWLLDTVMPNTTGNEFKIIAAVARQSLGWQYGGVVLSLSDFQELTGMSRPSVTSNIEKAIKSGYITQEEHGQGFVYRCVASKEVLLVKYPNQLRNFTSDSKETLPEVVKELYQSSKETLPVTSSPKEDTKEIKVLESKKEPAPKKQKAKPKKHLGDISELEIPEHLATTLFVNAFNEFINHRKMIGKPMTTLAGKRAMTTLAPFSEQDAISAINNAIVGGYQGLYPKHSTNGNKPNSKHKQQPTPRPATNPQYKRPVGVGT